jgi:predicted MFS family arabinose efflux permease
MAGRAEFAATGPGAPAGRPFALLALFLGMHVINHVDRHLVASFAPQIMADLALSRSEFALIAGLGFSIVYAVNALGAGLLADRIGRVRVLTAGAGTWSLFTAACGLATGFWSLLAMRPFVAAGEATLVPTATNILLSRTPERARATAMGLFFMGIPLGVGGSYLVAATLGPAIGWRYCFFLMGAIGIIGTLAVSRVRDERPDRTTTTDHPSSTDRLTGWWTAMYTNARLRNASIAIILFHAHMATGAFTQLWLVADKGFASDRAASLYGTFFILLGVAGSAGSGLITDWLHQRWRIDRARALAMLMLALAPLLIAYRLGSGESPLMIAGMAASVFYFTAAYGPCFSIIEKELPAELKATATGINMLLINILMIGGLALLIGLASDALAARGIAHSWTWPLLGADIISMLGVAALLSCPRSATDCSR